MEDNMRDQPTPSNSPVLRQEDADEDKRLPLNQTQSRTLAEVLLSPPQPNEKLRRAMEEFHTQIESR